MLVARLIRIADLHFCNSLTGRHYPRNSAVYCTAVSLIRDHLILLPAASRRSASPRPFDVAVKAAPTSEKVPYFRSKNGAMRRGQYAERPWCPLRFYSRQAGDEATISRQRHTGRRCCW